jgi:transposase-like protein
MSSKRYPEEFKIETVKQISEGGHSVAEVASMQKQPLQQHHQKL